MESKRGLSSAEARRRFEEFGPNALPEGKSRSLLVIFFSQFNSPLIFILLASSLIIYLIGETTDAIIILVVLLFNAFVGMIQEGRAENTLQSLRQFVETKATVWRDGQEFIIDDRDLVPGDVIILQEGEKIPADAQVILSQNLKVNEASLTGESEPVHKTVEESANHNLPPTERPNLLFKGTHIVSGNGEALVLATGTRTVIGKIATEISAIDTEIPLKTNIRHLSRLIIITVGIISTLLFSIGLASGESVRVMFTVVVSLAVSVIPEGLPIVLTLVLATGVWRMSKRKVLVKKLQAVEALGQARIIAVDKTGTITKNELVVRQVWVGGKLFNVSGNGYEPTGNVELGGLAVDAANHPELLLVGKIVALGSSARVSFSESAGIWRVSGDPTEAALVVLAQKLGFHKNELLTETPLVAELPFDYQLKYHASIHRLGRKNFLSVIGAPEVVLALVTRIRRDSRNVPLSAKVRAELEEALIKMSAQGQRVVAIAINPNSRAEIEPEQIGSLVFLGFVAMKDVLRPEVAAAMLRTKEAGIRVVMITGDHRVTAQAIAEEAGIYHPGDEILTGAEIDALSEAELAGKLARTSIFARVTPEHKLRIINSFKARGEVIAMTGDGVNDAPSLVAADLGVSMGNIGTEVAKEASDIVLLDDNFGSIVSAVEEGRHIYQTIKRVILYLFSTSLGEVLTITAALLLGLPLPLLAAQIIWLNLVTDGFLDISLAMEPQEAGLITRKFKRPNQYLIDKLAAVRMILMALPMMVGTLFMFTRYLELDNAKAWTISLTTLAMFQWFNAWNCRSEHQSIFALRPFANLYLVGATILVIVLQILAVYTPFLQQILNTVPLRPVEWLVIIPIAASIVVVEELRKFLHRRRSL